MSDVVKLPTLTAGARPVAIIPTTFEECYRLGQLLAASGMVPKEFAGKPEACVVAIMQGLEVGLSPMAAMQTIAVINGRPTLWGDGAMAVVRASGMLEWVKEWTEGDTAWCEAKRKGQEGTIKRSFSDADAKAAGLLGKPGPWAQYRPRMRQMRARSWTLRDGFPDALRGLGIAEEVQDIQMKDVTPKSAAQAKKDGTPAALDAFRALLANAASIDELDALVTTPDHVGLYSTLPNRWKTLVDDDLIVKRKELTPVIDPPLADAEAYLDRLRQLREQCDSIQELMELSVQEQSMIARLSEADQAKAAQILAE